MQVERAHRAPDLADQQARRAERGVVALTPQQPDPTGQPGQVAEQRPAPAHLAAVEAGAPDALRLDVDRLLGDARRVAQHVDEQIVTTDLPEARVGVARRPVASCGPLSETA